MAVDRGQYLMASKFQQVMRWVFTMERLEDPPAAPPEPKPEGPRHSAYELLFHLEPLEVLPEEQRPPHKSILKALLWPEPLARDEEQPPPHSLPLLRWLFWVEPLPRDEEVPKRKHTSLLSLLFSPEKLPPGGE